MCMRTPSPWRSFSGTDVGDTGSPDVVLGHISDLHGQLGTRHQAYFESGQTLERNAGLPVLAAALDALREKHTLFTLMSGDTFHGSAITTYTNGKAMIDPINTHLRPDIYVPGNWDYANEPAEDGNLQEMMDGLDATVIAANLYEWDSRELLYDSYTVTEVGGIALGIVGMTNGYVDRMAPAFFEGKYRFGTHPMLLAEAAAQARADGADIVVGVTEIGLPWSVQAAKDDLGIDVLFSAHTHEYTYDPIVIANTKTIVVESGLGEGLGRVDLRIRDGELHFRHHLYCLTEERPDTPAPDPDAEETVTSIREPFLTDDPNRSRGAGHLDRPLDTVVGRTKTPLHRQGLLESPWNPVFTNALREHFDTDLAVAHGFRYGTALPPGDITIGDVYTAFPQTSPVASGVAFGQQLTAHMEAFLQDNFSPYPYDQEDGRVRNFSSNVHCTINPQAKRGRRLVELLIDGEPIKADASYSVATFTRPGDPERDLGNCGFPFRDVQVDADIVPADVVIDYLLDSSPVAPEVGTAIDITAQGNRIQNTPAEGPYPFVQPGVDHGEGEVYCETALIPGANQFPAPDGASRR